MLEQWMRNPYQRVFVEPVIRCLSRKVQPWMLTLLSVLLGILFIPALLAGQSAWAVFLLVVSGYCDTLDGSLARHQKNTTNLGAVLDIMADRLVEVCIVFAFYLLNPAQHGLAVMLMLGSILLCVTSFLVVGIFTSNDSHKSFYYSPGIIERAEAFLFFIVMVLLPKYFVFLAFLFSGLVLLTAGVRLIQFRRLLKIGA